MKQNASNRKVNEQAREVIANTLLFDVSDPRLSLVTVTGCEVSFDRSVADVFYTADADSYDDVAEAFDSASGHIRSVMARKLSWRTAPELRFVRDESIDGAQAIEAALAREAQRYSSDGNASEGDAPTEEGDGRA